MFFGSFLSLHRLSLPSELDRPDGTEPPPYLTGVLLVHVEKCVITGLTTGLLLSSGVIVTVPRNTLSEPPSQYSATSV